MVTTDQHKEKRCVKEIFNVLNDYLEKVYPDLDVDGIIKAADDAKKAMQQRETVKIKDGEILKENPLGEKKESDQVNMDQAIRDEIQ